MLHREALKTVRGIIEIRHNGQGDAIHVFINNKRKAAIYGSLDDLIDRVYFGIKTEHFECNEDELFSIYENCEYDYKQIIEQLKSK